MGTNDTQVRVCRRTMCRYVSGLGYSALLQKAGFICVRMFVAGQLQENWTGNSSQAPFLRACSKYILPQARMLPCPDVTGFGITNPPPQVAALTEFPLMCLSMYTSMSRRVLRKIPYLKVAKLRVQKPGLVGACRTECYIDPWSSSSKGFVGAP